ncbi:hypothetical protein [Candidatus Ishikawella capsulata]|uniref:hypothetical protein n=1 Tax=Candidatus Ishikawella capsulata TaxID=168169 RepID=UPI00130D57CB|nr:hypothetical protein [Candidatus Ishikawaella capsulata]
MFNQSIMSRKIHEIYVIAIVPAVICRRMQLISIINILINHLFKAVIVVINYQGKILAN